jgi:hypothetical protein
MKHIFTIITFSLLASINIFSQNFKIDIFKVKENSNPESEINILKIDDKYLYAYRSIYSNFGSQIFKSGDIEKYDQNGNLIFKKKIEMKGDNITKWNLENLVYLQNKFIAFISQERIDGFCLKAIELNMNGENTNEYVIDSYNSTIDNSPNVIIKTSLNNETTLIVYKKKLEYGESNASLELFTYDQNMNKIHSYSIKPKDALNIKWKYLNEKNLIVDSEGKVILFATADNNKEKEYYLFQLNEYGIQKFKFNLQDKVLNSTRFFQIKNDIYFTGTWGFHEDESVGTFIVNKVNNEIRNEDFNFYDFPDSLLGYNLSKQQLKKDKGIELEQRLFLPDGDNGIYSVIEYYYVSSYTSTYTEKSFKKDFKKGGAYTKPIYTIKYDDKNLYKHKGIYIMRYDSLRKIEWVKYIPHKSEHSSPIAGDLYELGGFTLNNNLFLLLNNHKSNLNINDPKKVKKHDPFLSSQTGLFLYSYSKNGNCTEQIIAEYESINPKIIPPSITLTNNNEVFFYAKNCASIKAKESFGKIITNKDTYKDVLK